METAHHPDLFRSFARDVAKAPDDAWVLVCADSLGDTYLTAALGKAFRAARNDGRPIYLVVRQSANALAQMFSDHFDRIVALPDRIILEVAMKLAANGVICTLAPGHAFFVHPNYAPRIRADIFSTIEPMSQAAMYAVILGLPPDVELTPPTIDPEARERAEAIAARMDLPRGRSVILFPDANSWPETPDVFWELLAGKLVARGWTVYTNASGGRRGPRSEPLRHTSLITVPLFCVLPFAEIAGWVIGSLCGLMGIFASARLNCRKTIVAQAIWPDVPSGFHHPLPIQGTYPYAYQRRFDGRRYDIEEIRVGGDDSYESVAERVASGFNAAGRRPIAEPVTQIAVDSSPGDLLDRISILQIKYDRLSGEKRGQVEKELRVLSVAMEPLMQRWPALSDLLASMRQVNERAWDLNERVMHQFLGNEYGSEGWTLDLNDAAEIEKVCSSIRDYRLSQMANRERVRLKNAVNELCRSAWTEEKSYDLSEAAERFT